MTENDESLIQALRHRTRPYHDQLESVTEAEQLASQTYSLSKYTKLLLANLALHRSVDSQLKSTLPQGDQVLLGVPWSDFCGRLEEDLEKLGIGRDQNSTQHFPLENRAQTIGALYVSLGSTLGGRRIAAWLRSNPEISKTGALNYYTACEKTPPRSWPAFCRACELLDLSAAEREITLSTACDAFTFVENSFVRDHSTNPSN